MRSSIRTVLAFCLAILATMLFGKPVAHALDHATPVVTALVWMAFVGIASVLAWDGARMSRGPNR